MKRLTRNFILLLCLVASLGAFSQPNPRLRGTLVATAADRATVYLRASELMNNASFLSATICISLPDQSPSPNPTMTITNVHGTNLGWITEFNVNAQTIGHVAPRLSGGRAIYTFFGNDANASTISFGTAAFPFVELTFNRVGIADADIQLVDLSAGSYGSGGGPGFNAFFYLDITGTIGYGDARNTDVAQMFFGLPGTFLNTGGVSPSNVQLQQTLTPAFLKEFNVTKQGNTSALLNWTTSQEQNVSHFVIERSWSQTAGWTAISEVKAAGNTSFSTSYSFTDKNVYDGSTASKIAFYRIKAVDLNNRENIFPVRSLRFSATGAKEIGIYPNPAKDGFTLTIPLINPQSTAKIRLNLVNRIGQTVHAREINSQSASNYYYDIKTPGVISGEYMLQIILDGELLDTKKVIVQR